MRNPMLYVLFTLLFVLVGCGGGDDCKTCNSPTEPIPPQACTVRFAPSTLVVPADGGTFPLGLTKCNCTSAQSNVGWVTVNWANQTFTVSKNTVDQSRVAYISACGAELRVTQLQNSTAPNCTYSFPPSTMTWPAQGESSVGIGFTSSPYGCAWSASISSNPGDMAFNLSPTPTSGYTQPDGQGGGKGLVNLNLHSNTGGARVAIVTWTTPSGTFTTQIPQDAAPGF